MSKTTPVRHNQDVAQEQDLVRQMNALLGDGYRTQDPPIMRCENRIYLISDGGLVNIDQMVWAMHEVFW
jgi:hypothetical protein